jgi:integrase
MGRKSPHNLPPGIQLDQHGVYWAGLDGEEAKLWRERYPGRSRPRRKAATLKAAVKIQRQLIDDLKHGRDPNAENPKVADWVRTCIDRKRDLEPATRARYLSSLTWQIAPHPIGRMRLRQPQKKQVEEWVDTLIVQKHQRQADRTLSPHTIDRAFAVLRMAFNMAIIEGLIVKNPCKGVKLPKPDDTEITPLDPAQVETLLHLLDTYVLDKATNTRTPHRLAALYHLAIRCGPREGELIGIRWSDIDLVRGELRIVSQLQDRSRKSVKYRSHRTLPLTADLVRVLRWHLQNQREEQVISGPGWNDAGLVFCSTAGTPIDPSNLLSQFAGLLKQAGLPKLRFHDLRHTYAALSIAAGVDLYTLSRRMGHKSISVTADKYGHLYQGRTQDADALDRLLKRA